jgi:hypothetical protein
MKISPSVKDFFSQYDRIDENFQAAKEYLIKREAERLKKEKRDLSDLEKKRALHIQEWEFVKELTQKNPGYALIFLKFALDQKAPRDILELTFNELLKNKDKVKDLPMSLQQYADLEIKKNTKPGYELLIDDILKAEKKAKLKKFYNSLQSKMKTAFSQASPEKIDELEEISNQLDSLKPKDGKDPWSSFSKTLGKYENDKGYYPQFNNLEFAFETMIEEAKDFISSWSMDEDEYVSKIKEIKPQVEILYWKDQILAISTRTPEAQREVQGVMPWCLKYDSHFWNYVSGTRVQLVIVDNKKPMGDVLRSIGVTVEPDGNIHAAYDASNQSIRNGKTSYKTIYQLLKDNNYPGDLIKTLERKIPNESRIKKALMLFYRKEESKGTREIIKGLIDLSRGFLEGQLTEEEWENISADVTQIIFEERGFTKDDLLKQFKNSGIYSEASWTIWDRLIGKDYTQEDIKDILEKTKTNIKSMEDFFQFKSKDKKFLGNKEAIEKMEDILNRKDKIILEIEKRIK